jgi:RNA polymerase sigma-70 factor (ECF subfamily)
MRRLDEAAVREFALSFGPRFQRLFLRRGLPAVDAEALAVSCVSDVVMKIHRFQPAGSGSFERWVFTLAHYAWVEALRQRQREPSRSREPAWPETPDWDEPPAPALEAVRTALGQLSEEDQAVVQLHQVDGLSFAEVGRQLNMPEGTARVRHHRALKRLEGLLANHPAVRAWREPSLAATAQEDLNHD